MIFQRWGPARLISLLRISDLESEAINLSNKKHSPWKPNNTPLKKWILSLWNWAPWCFFQLRSQDRLRYKETRRPYRTPLVAWAGAFGSIQRGEAHVILVKGDDRSRRVFFLFSKKDLQVFGNSSGVLDQTPGILSRLSNCWGMLWMDRKTWVRKSRREKGEPTTRTSMFVFGNSKIWWIYSDLKREFSPQMVV